MVERKRRAEPISEAVAQAAKAGAEGRGTRGAPARSSDAFGEDIRRRDIFPLLVLHLVTREPTYGNRLIEEIERITQGAISVNPNTMYPLLREMEGQGLVEGRWELPDRRTRRYYDHVRRSPRVQAPAYRDRALSRFRDPLGWTDQGRGLRPSELALVEEHHRAIGTSLAVCEPALS